MLSFPTLILSITFLPNKIPHAWGKKKVKQQDLKSQNRSVHMSKSIKNDADTMLISVNISIMSLTESDTVFRVTSKERGLHGVVVWGPTWTQ